MTPPPTRSALVETIARAICENSYGSADDIENCHEISSDLKTAKSVRKPAWMLFTEHAEAVVAAIHEAGLAVVPSEADERLGYIGGAAFEEAAFANQKIVLHAAQDVWKTTVAAADLATERKP